MFEVQAEQKKREEAIRLLIPGTELQAVTKDSISEGHRSFNVSFAIEQAEEFTFEFFMSLISSDSWFWKAFN